MISVCYTSPAQNGSVYISFFRLDHSTDRLLVPKMSRSAFLKDTATRDLIGSSTKSYRLLLLYYQSNHSKLVKIPLSAFAQ